MEGFAENYLDIRLDRKKLTKHNVYLCGAACRKGSTETEIRRRIQSGASAWRKVEEVMGDISRNLNEKGLISCVPPAYLYGVETIAMTENQLEKLYVCENTWVKRIDNRRM